MKRPVIGVLPTHSSGETMLKVNMTYLEAVETAGGAPMMLPEGMNQETIDRLVEVCDGFLFTGGPDVDPRLYGEAPWYRLGSLSSVRDYTDPAFFKAAYPTGKPIIGICRGIQLINACMGGTLYQDLGSQYPRPDGVELLTHNQGDTAGYVKTHDVIAEDGSLLEKCWGKTFKVNSFHHQAVKDVAPGAVITARATDGVIEGISFPDHPYLHCVQWHPEVMAPQDQGARSWFKAFVDACRK